MSNENVSYLNYLIRTYKSITDMVAATKQRLRSLPGDHPIKFDRILHGEEKEEGLETVKGRVSRLIDKELPSWDVYNLWLKNVPGIGPVIAAELIMLYYYRHVPICKDCCTDLEDREESYWCPSCEKSVKGQGNLDYRIEEKDFPNIAKWWAYMGRDILDGGMRKKKKGTKQNWSAAGRKLGFMVGESFNKMKPEHEYKKIMLSQKAKYEKSQPEISKGWRHNKAKNNTVKLFLAHFWAVARELDGKSVTEPYAMVIMGHTGYIKPFYFEGRDQERMAG